MHERSDAVHGEAARRCFWHGISVGRRTGHRSRRPATLHQEPGVQNRDPQHLSVELGRLIRESELDTYVGGPYEQVEFGPDHEQTALTLVAHGECLSACVYAFAGGRIRTYGDQGSLGVHQFYGGLDDQGTTQVA